jgi:hypothetical protein
MEERREEGKIIIFFGRFSYGLCVDFEIKFN